MRSVTVRLDDLRAMILNLGFVGENEHRKFNFDCKKMFGEYPSASVSLTVQPPAGDCYPATVERNGDLVSWTVTDSDLIEEGCGEIQLTFMVGEVVAKTCIGRTKVERSLGATGDIPTPIENWIEQAEEVISEAEAATAAAEGAAEHQPIIDDNGYWAVWDADAEEYVATEYKAQGTDGHDGVGIVSIEKTGTSGLVDTYTITFTSGNPVTYTVTNGRDADPAELIDDNAGAGDTDKVWSADKSHALLTEITNAFDNTLPIKPYNAVFFDGANYFDPLFAEYIDGGLAINASGELFSASSNAKSLVIPVASNTQYSLFVPDGNRQYIGEKATNDFASGQTITMLVTDNGDYPCTFTTGATANYIFVYFNSGSYDYRTKKDLIKMCKGDTINNGYPKLNNNYLGQIPGEKLDIFKGVNLFNDADTNYRTDRNINPSTGVIFSSSTAKSIVFPVEANTRYSIYVPDGNRSLVAEGTDSSFAIGSTKTVLVSDATIPYPIEFTTGTTAKYVFITINVGDYDYATKKSGIKLFKGKYWNRPMPYLPIGNMDEEVNNLYGLNVLVFGDSITDCCNFTINSSDETTAYSWKNPSNSYIDAGGNAIAYSMWPKILKDTQPLGEIRNYALSGASVRSEQRTAGNERLNLQYQIDLAINDLDNPNHAFTVDNFVPDIVIFAIGTNDVTPNDTYDSAMEVITYLSDGVSVNVDDTMAQLDPTKFCQSARLAFLKIKKLFPMAQIYYYLPLQRARYQQNTTSLHTELEKMAKRYGCIIIDGTFESGIIAEFEQVDHLGALLKDGLHPNEKGQNLMARQILASIKSHFMPFEFGFNK